MPEARLQKCREAYQNIVWGTKPYAVCALPDHFKCQHEFEYFQGFEHGLLKCRDCGFEVISQ